MKSEIDRVVEMLRAAGEASRLRMLALLRHGDLSVGEFVDILGQSQPGVSQHLKTLTAAGLVERLPEGAWVYYRAVREDPARQLIDSLLDALPGADDTLRRDLERLGVVRAARAESADSYFQRNAREWDKIRALHYPNEAIEAALLEAAGAGPFDRMIDIGTGTGRMLALFAPRVAEAEGVDRSHDMLTIARANLDRDGIANAQVRRGDAGELPYEDDSADLVLIHQVLHYLDRPAGAVAEAARILKPGGRLVIVDFAPHALEFLRIDHAHRHLGLPGEAVAGWAGEAGLAIAGERVFDPPGGSSGLAVQIITADKPGARAPETARKEAVA